MDKLRVLVAEDNDVIRMFVVALLSKEFDVVGSVGDGEQLVESALISKPHVIVTDIAMPLMDGLLAREHLLAKGWEIPFVFITILDSTKLSFSLAENSIGYVHKMDIPQELSLAVRAVATGRSYLSQSLTH